MPMTLNASQILNNLKRSFNAFVATQLEAAEVNFDDDSFETSGTDAWYAIRYTDLRSESTGMGDLIDPDNPDQGRFHIAACEISAWHREDPQRVSLGGMVDKLIVISETESFQLFDYSDPENPVEAGTVYIRAKKGAFTPRWGGGGPVLKTSSDAHAAGEMVGFVVELDLITLAEVS